MGDTEAARGDGGASAMHDAAADFVKLEDHRVPSRKGGEELPAWRLVLDRVAGLALMAGSAATFSVVTLMVSLMADRFPVYQIVAVRFFTQWACAAVTVLIERQSLRVPREFWLGMLARCVFGVASMVFFYLALQHLAMANASVIRFTSPAMVSILAFLLYKEEFGWVQGLSTVMSMAGVVLVAQPHFIFGAPHVTQSSNAKGGGGGTSAQQSLDVGFAFAAAVAAAFAFLAIRRVNAVHPMVTTFWFSLSGFVTLAPVAVAVGGMSLPHTVGDGFLLFGTGVVGYLGQWFMCRSLQLEEAGPATMMRYLDVAFAYLFQIVIEHRSVDLLSPLGAAMVVSGAAVVTIQRWCWPKTAEAGAEQDAAVTPPTEADDEARPLIARPAGSASVAARRWRRAGRRVVAMNRVIVRTRAISLPQAPSFPGHGQRADLLEVTARALVDDF